MAKGARRLHEYSRNRLLWSTDKASAASIEAINNVSNEGIPNNLLNRLKKLSKTIWLTKIALSACKWTLGRGLHCTILVHYQWQNNVWMIIFYPLQQLLFYRSFHISKVNSMIPRDLKFWATKGVSNYKNSQERFQIASTLRVQVWNELQIASTLRARVHLG